MENNDTEEDKDDDYLKKVIKFKKYPKYYLKLKEALSLF